MNNRKQGQVQFAPQVQCKATLSRSELTPKEIAATWYSRKGQVQLIEKSVKLVQRRNCGKRPKPNTSYRGLEAFHENEYQQLQQEIETCVYAVILEQHRQAVEESGYNIEALATESLLHSVTSSETAIFRGKHDEREAMRIHKETELEDDEASQSSCSESSSRSGSMRQEFENLGKVVFATTIRSRYADIKV